MKQSKQFNSAYAFATKYLTKVVKPTEDIEGEIPVHEDGTESPTCFWTAELEISDIVQAMHDARGVLHEHCDWDDYWNEIAAFETAIHDYMSGEGYVLESARYVAASERTGIPAIYDKDGEHISIKAPKIDKDTAEVTVNDAINRAFDKSKSKSKRK